MAKRSSQSDTKLITEIHNFSEAVFDGISDRIKGNREIIHNILTAILCNGHVLLIGVPGLGKTLLIKSLASLLGLDQKRIQFTPDLMPSDITGTEIYDEKKREFKFIQGPVFSNIILADEINRTPPRTQAAMLQAMEERQISQAGVLTDLPKPFFVLATQNPIEQEGTYPLPEAQLDRFIFALELGYPTVEEEIEIAKLDVTENNKPLKPVTNAKKIIAYQELVRRVPIADPLIEMAVDIVRKTRDNELLEYGAGPRATQAIVLAAKARAALAGEYAVLESHIHAVLEPVMRHRVILNYQALADGADVEKILSSL